MTQRNRTGHTSKSGDFPTYLHLLHKMLSGEHNSIFKSPTLVDIAMLVDKVSLSMTLVSGATVRVTLENSYIVRSISSLLKPVAQRMDQLTPEPNVDGVPDMSQRRMGKSRQM